MIYTYDDKTSVKDMGERVPLGVDTAAATSAMTPNNALPTLKTTNTTSDSGKPSFSKAEYSERELGMPDFNAHLDKRAEFQPTTNQELVLAGTANKMVSEPMSESGTNVYQNRGGIGDECTSESQTNQAQNIGIGDKWVSESQTNQAQNIGIGDKWVSESGTNAPYNSNSIYKRITIIGGDAEGVSEGGGNAESGLPEAWQNIDTEPLSQIGFSLRHLQVLCVSGATNPQTVQESINHYAWGLANNAEAYKKYTNPLLPLLGVLKKGGSWIESGYESPQSISLKVVTQLQDKRRRQEKERIDELVKIEFPTWRDLVGQDRLDEIAPKGCIGGISGKQILWQEHFRKHVLLPKLRAEGAIEFYDSHMEQPSARAASK